MDEQTETTVIRNAVKDLYSFAGINKRPKISSSQSLQETMSTKNSDETDAISPGNSFVQKHRDNVVGFDIVNRIREKNKEINNAQTKITLLEIKIETMQNQYKEASIKHEAELENLRRLKMENKDTIENLERKITLIKKKENETKKNLIEDGNKLQEQNVSLQQHVTESSRQHLLEKEAFLEEIESFRKKYEQSRKSLQEKELEIFSLQTRVKDLEEEVTEFQQQRETANEESFENSRLKQAVSQKDTKISELNHRLELLKDHEEKLQSYEEAAKKLYLLETEVFKLNQENSGFRKAAVNTCIIEEKLSSAQRQIDFLESRCKSLSEDNGTLLSIKEQFRQYEEVIKDELQLMSLPAVNELKDQLNSLCTRDAGLQKTIDALKSGVESHECSRKQLEDSIRELKAEAEVSKDNTNKKNQYIKRLQRKISLVSKERDSLKGLISSYESEATINPSITEQHKITKLEEHLEAYKNEISKLEAELEQFCPDENIGTSQKKENTVSQSKKVVELEEVIRKLNEEKDSLEHCIATQIPNGSFNPLTTKVLEFKNNPLTQIHNDRTKEMQRLRKENDALQCRIRLMEEGDTADLTQKVNVKVETLNPKYVKELEEKITEQKQSHEQLQSAFTKNVKMLRQAVLKLTGYRFDFENEHWKLFHMYMEDKSDHLLLQKDSEGNFELLETEFSSRLGPLIEEHLQQDSSYPAFLAALTMKLFHKNSASEDEENFNDEDDDDNEDEGSMDEDDEGQPPSKRPRTSEDEDLICLD